MVPNNGWLYFPVKGNVAYKKDGWSGSVSVWCNTDPDRLIKSKFCDPVQITQNGYDNGALWFDFNDAKPRALRFGAFTARPAGQKAVAESDPKAPLVRLPEVGWRAGSGTTWCSRSRTSTRASRTPRPRCTSTASGSVR